MDPSTPPDHIAAPSASSLLRSTAKAALAAGVLLVTIVLPAEYGIDPTGVGRLLGLQEMGEIKMQLAREAEADAATVSATLGAADAARLDAIESRLDEIQALLAAGDLRDSATTAGDVSPSPSATNDVAPAWRDEITITLTPGQGVEYKLVMNKGAEAEFEWTANGGALNYDTHGSGGGQSISYKKGRGEPEGSGSIVAEFDGNHGWFFRNRTDVEVQLTLKTRGDYSAFKRVV